MKFHITITNNETGKIVVDQDTDCIIGSIDDAGDDTHSFSYVHCHRVALMATLTGAMVEIEKSIRRLPAADQKLVRKIAKQETKQ